MFDYHYLDDNVLIKDNLYRLEEPSYILQSFQEGVFHDPDGAGLYYRPLLSLSFFIDAQFGSDSLFFFHLTNIILHLIAACLVFVLLKKLKFKQWFVNIFSLFYLIHPIQLQAIAWLPGRNDPLLAIFLFGGFIFFLNFIETNKKKWYVLFLLFYILTLFIKETAIMLPAICLLYLWLIKKEKIFSLKSWQINLAYLLITLPWLWLRSVVLQEQISANYNILASLLANFPAVIPFIGKIFFPINLSTLPILADMPMIYGLLAIVTIIVLLYFSKEKKWSYILFGLFWFVLFLLPSFIRPLSSLADFAEHRMYIPLVGIIIILSQIKITIKNPQLKKIMPTVLTVGTIIVLGLFLTKTITHARVYEDKLSFWTSAVKYSPNSAFNHNNLGAMYYIDSDYAQAKKQWLIAKKLNPNEPLVSNNLGLIYDLEGEYNKAYNEYLKELQINPSYANAHYNLSLLLFKTGYPDKAVEGWQKTIELNPDYFSAYNNLTIYYLEQGDLDQAKYYLNTLLERGGIPMTGLSEKINESN